MRLPRALADQLELETYPVFETVLRMIVAQLKDEWHGDAPTGWGMIREPLTGALIYDPAYSPGHDAGGL